MSRKTHRDHAKKKQRPMVEDQVIAEHLTSLLTPAMKSSVQFFSGIGTQRQNSHPPRRFPRHQDMFLALADLAELN